VFFPKSSKCAWRICGKNSGYTGFMSLTVTVWILADQLLERHPALEAALAEFSSTQVVVLFLESRARATRLPYHRRKLALLFSASRHYAQELRQAGLRVDYRQADTVRQALLAHQAEYSPGMVLTMAASEYRGRQFQTGELDHLLKIPVKVLPNTQFLVGRFNPISHVPSDKPVIMENFYRQMRRQFGVLLEEDGQPVGGDWNFDAQNRRPLPKDILLPELPDFPPDELTRQVIAEIHQSGVGTGDLAGFNLAVTRAQALETFADFLENRLENYGPYEDAMTSRSNILFHSMLSPYLNLGLLEPLELVQAAEQAYRIGRAPINSVEGFIRQVLGWREYIYWQYWRQMPTLAGVNFWKAHRPLPQFFWSGETQMNCLAHVLGRTHRQGYAHHIERLMLLTNFCLLAGVTPQEVNRWFLSSFIDAYEWVMLPNVLGMGLYADGGLTATKPYLASANYIHKMGDYCQSCQFEPKQRTGENACPFNFLYWNFLLQHESLLRANPRMGKSVLSLRHLDDTERSKVQRQAAEFLAAIEAD
jgi:deoxyribodipyrimidine photolyase-related protein